MKLSTLSFAAVACLIADTASAHAHLQSAVPAEGSTLSAAPSAIDMTFSEAARLTALSIQKDQQPKQAVKDLPSTSDRTLHVALPALTAGAYTLTWRVLGADGHVTSGDLHFKILP